MRRALAVAPVVAGLLWAAHARLAADAPPRVTQAADDTLQLQAQLAAAPPRIAAQVGADGTLRLEANGERLVLGPRRVNGAEAPLAREQLARGGVAVRWPWADERLEPMGRGLELKWRFERVPGDGGFSVAWTTSHPSVAEGRGASAGVFSFGAATWVDSKGLREPLALNAVEGGVRIDVPADVVARSHFPAELDPMVTVRSQQMDLPRFGPIGGGFPMVHLRGSKGALSVVFHQRGIECHLYDDDGGLKAIHQLPFTLYAVNPGGVVASGDQLLLAAPNGLARTTDDCAALLQTYPLDVDNVRLVSVDGGWAVLTHAPDSGVPGPVITRYTLDGGVGPSVALGGPRLAGAAATATSLVVVQMPNAPNANPVTVSFLRPTDWSVTATSQVPHDPAFTDVEPIALADQVLVGPTSSTGGARRFAADGGLLDMSDLDAGFLYLFAAGDRYALLNLTSSTLMDTSGNIGPTQLLVPDGGIAPCRSLVWGPRPMCGSPWPEATETVRWYDSQLSAFDGLYVPSRAFNTQLPLPLVVSPSRGWVTWIDNREGTQQIFAATLGHDGTLSAPSALFAEAALGSGPWTTAYGDQLAIVGSFPVTLAIVDVDAGAIAPVRLERSFPISGSSVNSVAIVDDTMFGVKWGFSGMCSFAPLLLRASLDGGQIDPGYLALGCNGFGVPRVVAGTGGAWVTNPYLDASDGGFKYLGDLYFVPTRGPPVTVRSGVSMQLNAAPPVPFRDGACYPTAAPFRLECGFLDGGITQLALPGPAYVTFDGQRFHASVCLAPDGGAELAVIEVDGGTQLFPTQECGPVTALEPGHLAWVGSVDIDGGLEGIRRVVVHDYYTLDVGTACMSGAQCLSGFCVDGVCCESACGFSAADCQSCGADGHCRTFDAGTLCRAVASACDVAEVCDGVAGECPVDVAPVCDGGSGATDAGVDAGAGPQSLVVGCGCHSLGGPMALIALLTLGRRRLRGRCRRSSFWCW